MTASRSNWITSFSQGQWGCYGCGTYSSFFQPEHKVGCIYAHQLALTVMGDEEITAKPTMPEGCRGCVFKHNTPVGEMCNSPEPCKAFDKKTTLAGYINKGGAPVKVDAGKATEGLRYNTGKRRFDLLPPDGLALLADLFTRGAEKYAERNWEKGMDYSKVSASLERHFQDWKAGIDRDEETGMLHMIHVVWNALVLATYQLRGIGRDDRKAVKMPPAYVPSTPSTR